MANPVEVSSVPGVADLGDISSASSVMPDVDDLNSVTLTVIPGDVDCPSVMTNQGEVSNATIMAEPNEVGNASPTHDTHERSNISLTVNPQEKNSASVLTDPDELVCVPMRISSHEVEHAPVMADPEEVGNASMTADQHVMGNTPAITDLCEVASTVAMANVDDLNKRPEVTDSNGTDPGTSLDSGEVHDGSVTGNPDGENNDPLVEVPDGAGSELDVVVDSEKVDNVPMISYVSDMYSTSVSTHVVELNTASVMVETSSRSNILKENDQCDTGSVTIMPDPRITSVKKTDGRNVSNALVTLYPCDSIVTQMSSENGMCQIPMVIVESVEVEVSSELRSSHMSSTLVRPKSDNTCNITAMNDSSHLSSCSCDAIAKPDKDNAVVVCPSDVNSSYLITDQDKLRHCSSDEMNEHVINDEGARSNSEITSINKDIGSTNVEKNFVEVRPSDKDNHHKLSVRNSRMEMSTAENKIGDHSINSVARNLHNALIKNNVDDDGCSTLLPCSSKMCNVCGALILNHKVCASNKTDENEKVTVSHRGCEGGTSPVHKTNNECPPCVEREDDGNDCSGNETDFPVQQNSELSSLITTESSENDGEVSFVPRKKYVKNLVIIKTQAVAVENESEKENSEAILHDDVSKNGDMNSEMTHATRIPAVKRVLETCDVEDDLTYFLKKIPGNMDVLCTHDYDESEGSQKRNGISVIQDNMDNNLRPQNDKMDDSVSYGNCMEVNEEYNVAEKGNMTDSHFMDCVNMTSVQMLVENDSHSLSTVDTVVMKEAHDVINDELNISLMKVVMCDKDDIIYSNTVKDMDLSDVNVRDDDITDECSDEQNEDDDMKDEGAINDEKYCKEVNMRDEEEIGNACLLGDEMCDGNALKDAIISHDYSCGEVMSVISDERDTDNSDVYSVMSDRTIRDEMSIAGNLDDDEDDNDDDNMSDSLTVKDMDTGDVHKSDDDSMSVAQNIPDDDYDGEIMNDVISMHDASSVKDDEEMCDVLRETNELPSDDACSLMDDEMNNREDVLIANVCNSMCQMNITSSEDVVSMNDCSMKDNLSATGTMTISDIPDALSDIDDDISDSGTLKNETEMNDVHSESDIEEMKSIVGANSEINMSDVECLNSENDDIDSTEGCNSWKDVIMTNAEYMSNDKMNYLSRIAAADKTDTYKRYDALNTRVNYDDVIDAHFMGDDLLNIIKTMKDMDTIDTCSMSDDSASVKDSDMSLSMIDVTEMSVTYEMTCDDDSMSDMSTIRDDTEMLDAISLSCDEVESDDFAMYYYAELKVTSKTDNYAQMDEDNESNVEVGMGMSVG